MREQGRSKTGVASLPHVKLAPVSAPSPTSERQKHLDAIISFAGAGQRRRLSEDLTFSQLSGRQAICRKNADSFLTRSSCSWQKEKDPTSKQFDDEWLRSLTEPQEVTTDVREDSVLYDQQAVDPKKGRPTQIGEFLRKYVSRRLLALREGEIAAPVTAMRQLGVGFQGGAEALSPSFSSFPTSGPKDH